MTAFFIVLVVYSGSLAIEMFLAYKAPLGYQDETGWHTGEGPAFPWDAPELN